VLILAEKLAALVERLDNVRGDLREHRAESKEAIAGVHEQLQEIRADVDAIRLANAKRNGWVLGASAVVTLAFNGLTWVLKLAPLAILIAGCGAGPVYKHWGSVRPVIVTVDSSLPDECEAVIAGQLQWWASFVSYLEYESEALHARRARFGEITITDGTFAGAVVALTVRSYTPLGQMLTADISLGACRANTVRHELGHALGLPDLYEGWEGNVMCYSIECDGESLTPEQIAAVNARAPAGPR